jgi:serine kinase of HPr protein (carbohydrate metabolism regulator)
VADDQVRLTRAGARLRATALALAGHLEVRGQGVYSLAHLPSTVLDLAVRVGPAAPGRSPVRLPERETERILDVDLPLIRLDDTSSAGLARIQLALFAARVEPAVP